MERGGFLLADCLGFRGIWDRVDSQLLIARLQAVDAEVNTVVRDFGRAITSVGPVKPEVRFLSDSIALSVPHPNPSTDSLHAVQMVTAVCCYAASRIARLYLDDDELPLLLRGCITEGKHFLHGNFLIGPAVDAAAEHANIGDGAFIWLLPPAAKQFRDWQRRHVEQTQEMSDAEFKQAFGIAAERKATEGRVLNQLESKPVVDVLRRKQILIAQSPIVIGYAMPLKDGRRLDVEVINPPFPAVNKEARQRLIERFEKTVSDDAGVDIRVKSQNTRRFLESANAECEAYREKMSLLDAEHAAALQSQ